MNQEQMNKPFSIPKQLIFDAWEGVRVLVRSTSKREQR